MRPLILGMNHPKSIDPERALAPDEPRTAGARLYEMTYRALPALTQDLYREAFELRNVVLDTKWSAAVARQEAALIRGTLTETPGRVVVALGREVRDALRVPREWPWVLPRVQPGGWIARCLPHPSGLCRWYNDPVCRVLAGMMLAELAADSLYEQAAESPQTQEAGNVEISLRS